MMKLLDKPVKQIFNFMVNNNKNTPVKVKKPSDATLGRLDQEKGAASLKNGGRWRSRKHPR